MKEIVKQLLSAPDTQLHVSMRRLVQQWADPPTALQVLEVLDHCVHGALASGFVMTLLRILYDNACTGEGVTPKDVEKGAVWRNV